MTRPSKHPSLWWRARIINYKTYNCMWSCGSFSNHWRANTLILFSELYYNWMRCLWRGYFSTCIYCPCFQKCCYEYWSEITRAKLLNTWRKIRDRIQKDLHHQKIVSLLHSNWIMQFVVSWNPYKEQPIKTFAQYQIMNVVEISLESNPNFMMNSWIFRIKQ